MSDLRDVLIRGSEKVIENYLLLLARSTNEGKRKRTLYRQIEREQRLLDELQVGSPPNGWRSWQATASVAEVCDHEASLSSRLH